ncbi:SpvB/TcaC N-terminal domain-containing protein [Halomonas chromatireducens]|uniref:Mono(ADP-ribosyl)transferase SpvB n=1 Tax=Halomonas chromatireducens TaxID=507626 RepID=A0A0X8HCC7_9GAMM|nr:SpvB/TcaC N-terminal domain-containing protein [Halomonas chromatireducens]AMC99899.1 Mono(ADP-ribosyl)transferase SpvB [Halomonas chromatireducens]
MTTSSQAGPVISLPQGGGALSGIGETFSPDVFTGTGNFTIPLSLPEGRNGFQPRLNLLYSTGNGNGPFGLGWDLGIPGVSRRTAKGVPRYGDAEDVFILSGAEDLVPVSGDFPDTVRYRPRTEELFADIAYRREAGSRYWEVHTRDGLVSTYGTPGRAASEPAVIADPADPSRVFAWKLTRTVDPFGNAIEYEYERDTGKQDGHHWDQLYLKRIRYVDFSVESDTRFLVCVAFDYADRPDSFSEYRAGFEIRTRRRCRQITVSSHADKDRAIRSWRFVYLDERIALGESQVAALPRNGISLLSRIEVTGHDGDDTQELPPLEFGYTALEPDERAFFPIRGRALPAKSLASPDLELADLFGNGLPDLFELSDSIRYWRNLGNGRFDLPREMSEAPAGLRLADSGVQLIDANGNGSVDLLVTSGPLAGYFPMARGGAWDRRSFRSYPKAPSFNLEDPEVQLIDLNGDGVTDAVRSGARFEYYFNDPRKGWTRTTQAERGELGSFPNVKFSDPRVRWADMTGDGLQDIVMIHDGSVDYWPNLGHGEWGRRVSMRTGPRFPHGYDPERILIGDVDGDGVADIVYVDDGKVLLYINQCGNRWSEATIITGTPGADADVRLVDLLGSGISGLLWSRDAHAPGRTSLHFLDFTAGVKPYLLNHIDNHIGAVTRVEYAPSTRYYLDDEQDPRTRWRTPLPFPVPVVASVEVIDAISGGKLTTEYRYHHGYWDGAEREFRGFGRVDQRDTEAFDRFASSGLHPGRRFDMVEPKMFSPPIEKRTWFHQGPVVERSGSWSESDYSQEYWKGDPPLLDHAGRMAAFLQSYSACPDEQASSADAAIKRDALRALRGNVLRSELYALDDSPLQGKPYTVNEYAYDLREEACPDDCNSERRRIFFPHRKIERTTRWERGDDPMTRFMFSDAYDDFGQPQQQTSIAMPRRKVKRRSLRGASVGALDGDDVNETRVLASHTRTDYAVPDENLYIRDRIAHERGFEMNAPPEVDESDPTDLQQILVDQAFAARSIHEQFRSSSDLRLIRHLVHHYDGEAFIGREAGELGPYGALTRTEALVSTEQELVNAYGERRPTYLGGATTPPQGAPEGFAQQVGYHRQEASEHYHAGYYADQQRKRFDFQEDNAAEWRGMVTAVLDPLGHRTTIDLDRFRLFPARVVNAVGLEKVALHDYRAMQLRQVTDANGNTKHFRYTPLGMLHKQFLESRDGEGGSERQPEIELEYDFLAYERSRGEPKPQPVFIQTRKRVRHASDDVSNETVESREYSDGLGRVVQVRAQAEDLVFGDTGDDVGLAIQPGVDRSAVGRRVAERVVVSGWKVHDNKGEVVERYEPFFSNGWDFQPKADASTGRHSVLFRDPRGRVIRTLMPDGSEERVIFGTPHLLEDPEDFAPSAWERYTYDSNDLAPLSMSRSDEASGISLTERAPPDHHFTPASIILDGLDRAICRVERNGKRPGEDWFITKSSYDLRGKLLTDIDELGRPAFTHAYDLLERELSVAVMDAGRRTTVFDAAGNVIEHRDSKGSVVLHQYDDLNRRTGKWARDAESDAVTLRERIVYGDDEAGSAMNRAQARQRNLLGQLFRHYDEAGRLTCERYDFEGNLTEQVRQVISDTALEQGWRADWSRARAGDDLDGRAYRTSTRYDALGRAMELVYPADAGGHRARLVPQYDRAGALQKVSLDGDTYVAHIAYNARGQRVLAVWGNDVMTRYAYDPYTFRLARLRSERYRKASPDTFAGHGAPLQDFTYRYDLAGNVESIAERTPNAGIADTSEGRDRLRRNFSYDPLYRLSAATGRACSEFSPTNAMRCGNFEHSYRPGAPLPNQHNAPELTAAYTERYAYDPAGNLRELHRSVGESIRKRRFVTAAGSNRLVQVSQESTEQSFQYDANGNMSHENTERHFAWDHADRLVSFVNRPHDASRASVEVRYLYAADGSRIKKYVRKNGAQRGASKIYIGGAFEHDRWAEGGTMRESIHLHVMDDRQRIALLRRGPAHPDDAGPPVQYHLADHLGSSHVVINADGGWINREEYFPYGETSFGSFARKRYRFVGKERDEESGLYYQGARYYAPTLARWMSCDPAGDIDGLNLYRYGRDNPLRFVDPGGMESEEPQQGSRSNPITVHSLEEVPENVRTDVKQGELEGWYQAPQDFGTVEHGDLDTAAEIEDAGGKFYRYLPDKVGTGAGLPAGERSLSGATSELDQAKALANAFGKMFGISEKLVEGHVQSRIAEKPNDLSRTRALERQSRAFKWMGKLSIGAPGYLIDAYQVATAENRAAAAAEKAVAGGTGLAAAKAAAAMPGVQAMRYLGPKGWLAYGVIVVGAGIAGSEAGKRIFNNLRGVEVGPVPGGRPGRDRAFDIPDSGASEW